MERRGADKYPAAFVQKTFKELEVAGKADLDTADSAASSSATASGSKDTEGAKAADGPKTSVRVKKTARGKKTAAAKDTNTDEANEEVVVKEEEIGDDDA